MNKEEVKTFLVENPGYLKCSAEKVLFHFENQKRKIKSVEYMQGDNPLEIVKQVMYEIKHLEPARDKISNSDGSRSTDNGSLIVGISKEEYEAFLAYKEFTKELDTIKTNVSSRIAGLTPYNGNVDNVLIIGDLHCPFDLNEYLRFCREQQEKFDCGTVVFIGDIVDNHYSSFHTSELDTVGPNQEFD